MAKEYTILIATTNAGKAVEMRKLFEEYAQSRFKLITPDEAGILLEVEEEGKTYRENAELKARVYNRIGGMITLADDTGLEVEALDGRPGLYSARYIGANRPAMSSIHKLTDADRRLALLEELKPYPRPWKARFYCAVALAFPDGSVLVTDGICTGEIVPQERGEFGFGYDPIFQMNDPAFSGLTMAELNLEQKNRISHRAVAVRKAIELLENRIAG